MTLTKTEGIDALTTNSELLRLRNEHRRLMFEHSIQQRAAKEAAEIKWLLQENKRLRKVTER